MEYKRFYDAIVVRLDKGEEILEQMRELAMMEKIHLASVQGIGAVDKFTIGVFDTQAKQFCLREYTGCYEIVSLTGSINTMNGEFYCHLHMSAADGTGAVVGGHLSNARISATAELVIRTLPGRVERVYDPEIGLNLLDF